ncbi:MAG: hypothetical protein GWP08_21875, partial [Nitrospiraceae bacterium]|nr:hypothetical protein [Nitrospiraceae bacterium]
MARFIPDPKTHPITGVRRFALDAAAMLVYITLVYVWALRLHPLGRDYGMMAAPHFMPFATGRILEWEMRVFGGSPTGYHLVSLGFLYACMLAVYRLTRLTVQSYFWLGTLAAVLFMANPVHSEAVLNLTGISDLVPALLALLALVAYASHAAAPRLWRFGAALVLFACAVMPYSTNLFLIVVLLLFEVFIRGKERRLMRLLPFALLSLPMWWLQRDLLSDSLHPNHMLPPLYLVFYPIGLLPSTART